MRSFERGKMDAFNQWLHTVFDVLDFYSHIRPSIRQFGDIIGDPSQPKIRGDVCASIQTNNISIIAFVGCHIVFDWSLFNIDNKKKMENIR